MGYSPGKNADVFTFSSFGNANLDTSRSSLRTVSGKGIRHCNDTFRFVAMLMFFGFATIKLLFRLHDLLQPSSFIFTILVWYTVASLLTFVLYYLDKNHWPVRGNAVHCLKLFGGWPGAFAAQKLLRHEIREPVYRSRYQILVGMSYLPGKNTGVFTFSSFGNAILDYSINCLRTILYEARIQQHCNEIFWSYIRLVSMLLLFEYAALRLLFRLHYFPQHPSFILTVVVWYTVASLFTFGLYYLDKTDDRVYRKMLHFFEFNGGWPGALAAQKLLRHEIRAPGYQFWLEILVKLNVFLLIACGLVYNRECLIDYIGDVFHTMIGFVEWCEPYLQRIDNIVFLIRFLVRYIKSFAALCDFLWVFFR